MMQTLVSDLRHGTRVLLRAPVFTLSTVLVLGLGIGATTAVFALVNALLVRPLPYANAERLVMIWEHNVSRNRPRNVISAANFLAWRDRSTSFEDMGIFTGSRTNLTGSGDPEELPGTLVSANLLSMVGARPLLGRVFATGDDQEGSTPTGLITEGLWERRFGGRSDIIGTTITLDGRPTTIIGILPTEFELFGQRGDLWLPLVLSPQARQFSGRGFLSAGLLKSGISRDHAQQEMEAVAAQLTREHPEFDSGWTVNLVPMREQLVGDLRPALFVLFGAVTAVLLIACANLVNLLLARATGRQHELALRAALGAGARQLVRHLFIETALLVTAGGVVGVLLARWLQRLIIETSATQAAIPLLGQVRMDMAVVGFAAGATALTAVACGLGPALTARRPSLASTLKEGGRGTTDGRHGRIRAALVATEVAVAVTLLAGAGLLVRSFIELQRVDPGFDTTNVLTMRVIRSVSGPDGPAEGARFHENVVSRLRSIPGVQSAAGTVFLPLAGMGSATSFWLADRPEPPPADKPVADIRPVTTGYFRTLGIRMLAGRDFEDRDTPDRPLVTVVNESFVRRFYPGENPLGKRLIYSWDRPTTVEVVGVVGDVRLTSLDGAVRTTMYLPNQQRAIPMMTFVTKTAADPVGGSLAAVGVVRGLDPNQPVALVRTLDEVVSRSLSRPRVTSSAIMAFALVALLLAVIGVYGVVSYGVSQRLPEFGIRLALGAEPSDVLRMVLRQGMTMVVIGVAIGIAAAIPLSNGLQALLYGVEPGDPLTLAAVAAIIVTVALVACYIPARMGTRVDPAITLRAQ